MELWSEYEGRTIDSVFPLKRLLRPEGRSAFFLTSNGTGVPRVIRLIEPHFDEDEILARWRGVVALNHPNILKLEKFGQVLIDGAPLLYAVVEPADADLGDVLTHQRLTLPDARQLAASLNSALESLHSNGFVHEHVEPENIYAVGEVVKLRSDCIREAPEGREGLERKKQDLHDFAVVLLQALTQQRTLEAATRDLPLPAPFDLIVRNTMSGEWGTAEIAAALEPPASSPTPSPGTPRIASEPVASPLGAQASPLGAKSDDPPPAAARIPVVPARSPRSETKLGTGSMILIGLAAVLVLWLGWHFLSSRPASSDTSQPAATGVASSAPASTPSATPGASAGDQRPAQEARNQWRVIAYTYNHEDQAQHKAATVAKAHPELHPRVFTPTGRAPYLVALGGAMSRDEAFALAEKARTEGLPHDVYAQNYSGSGR